VVVAGIASVMTAFVVIVAVNLASGEHKISKRVSSPFGVADPQFARSMNTLFGPPLVAGNRVTSLYNRHQIVDAMLEDIRGARQSGTFETYIYWSGSVGQRFTEALIERARSGVKVHLIIDAVGSGKADATQLRAMRAAGAEVEKYQPIHWYSLKRINNRTHRKLLIVDERIGFTGGVGIADKWDGDAEAPEHWRDTHFRVVRPVVAQMHCKVMVVDDLWVSVGSTNFDNRSFRLNAEANLNAVDPTLARHEREAFESDRLRSRRIALEAWRHRPQLDRIGDWFAGLLDSQL